MEQKIVVGISGLLENKKGELLFLRRSPKSSWGAGQYQLPEGKMEWGETPLQTLEREVEEETSGSISDIKLLGVRTGKLEAKGTSYHIVRIIYCAKYFGNVVLSEDHDDFKWKKAVNASELNLAPDIQNILHELIQ